MAIKVKRKLFMESSKNEWEERAVLNPTILQDKDGVEHMFYRAVSKDWISSIGYAKITDDKIERSNKPIIKPSKSYDKKGVEDPRITKIGKTYYLLYTAFDGKDARIAYATSKDLKKWKKRGIISPNISVKKARKLVKIKKYRDKWKNQEVYGARISLWDKDAVLFPKKINGKFIMLHRFIPDIQVVKFKKFSELQRDSFWEKYVKNLSEEKDDISLFRRYHWEGEHIGAGPTPIKTKDGWLVIYHGVELGKATPIIGFFSKTLNKLKKILNKTKNKRPPLIYHAGAALLDLKKPETEIGRLKNPLFSPTHEWEKEGDINDVVFPEGASIQGNKLKIYYGCSDSRIGIAEVNLKQLINQIKKDS